MSDTDTATATDTDTSAADGNGKTEPVEKKDGADAIVESINGLQKMVTDATEKSDERFKTIEETLTKASEAQYPFGAPNGGAPNGGAHGVRTGESPMTSRPYSLALVAKRIRAQRENVPGWKDIAKPEFELSDDLRKAYGDIQWKGYGGNEFIVPLSADLMPMEDRETDDGQHIQAIPAVLRKRCRDIMRLGEPDLDELEWLAKRHNLPVIPKDAPFAIAKDMSAQIAITGGTLVAEAAQGELINILRAQEVWSRVGANQIDLPPQGSISFPRITGTVTVAATSEAATVSESTPATARLLLQAKPYTTLVDIPDELFRFASISVEAWLRTEMTRETALKTDRDNFDGAGGTAIQGAINFSGVNLRVASTVAANGDTLDAPDPQLLFGDIADQDAPVERGFFFAMTNSLWAGLSTRQATTNEFIFSVTASALGGGRAAKSVNGEIVIATTQVPRNRIKGSGTTLTTLFGGVGPEWYIARSGIITIDMTNSDASKFQQRLSTLRSTMYADSGPLHEESFGYIDDLLDS